MKVVWGEALEEGGGWIRYLGKEWTVRDGIYSVRVPPAYWRELLTEAGLIDCRAVATPAELTSEGHDDTTPLSAEDHRAYRRIVGKVMYGSIVRPDLAYV
eukprot:6693436-Heterocapsa_arctica.AAC.1